MHVRIVKKQRKKIAFIFSEKENFSFVLKKVSIMLRRKIKKLMRSIFTRAVLKIKGTLTDPEERKWTSKHFNVKEAFPSPRYFHAMCEVNENIYLYGGVTNRETAENNFYGYYNESKKIYFFLKCLNSIFNFKPAGKWYTLANDPGKRYGSTLIHHQGKLWLFGGYDRGTSTN